MRASSNIQSTPIGASRPGSSSTWWLLGFFIITVLRLALTGDRDILALNAPHDEFWHIRNASRFVWGGAYDQFAFAHLQTYSIWLTFLHVFGVSARFAIDAAWLAAAGYLALALHQVTRNAWVTIFVFLFLAFHPYTLGIFDRALAETLLAVLCTSALAAAIELWNVHGGQSRLRGRLALLIYVASFALAYQVRKEGVVLLVPLIFLACWSWRDRRRWWTGPVGRSLGMKLIVAPVAGIIAAGALLAGANYLAWGMFVRHELDAPGYQHALAALSRIDVGRTPKHVTVTARARELAFRESATFRLLRPYFDGEPGQQLAKYSLQFTGVPDEIGNGWFYWALRDAGARIGWYRDAPFADQKYAEIGEQLEQAFSAGRLPQRAFGLGAFLDPDVAKWASSVPGSWFTILRLVAYPAPGTLALPKENASAGQFATFVSIAGRRNVQPSFSVAGWIIAPARSLVSLVGTDATSVIGELTGSQRPDVPGAFPFKLSLPDSGKPAELRVATPDGRQGKVAIELLKTGQVAKFSGAFDGPVGIDQLPGRESPSRLDRLLLNFRGDAPHVDMISQIGEWYGWIGYALYAACFWYAILVAIRRKQPNAAFLIFMVAVSIVLARTALLAVLDATSWSGIQVRYVLPVVSPFACMAAISLAGIFSPPASLN